jgi:hypothetical protein
MKYALVLVFGVGCASTSPPPAPVVPANSCPAPELSCKAAVVKASSSTKLAERDITMAIGECDQHEWSLAARQCVADATASSELVTCGSKFSLGKRGIFADRTSLDVIMKVMNGFRDQMCACKDSACAMRVSEDMTKWGQQQAAAEQNPPKMTDEDTRRFTQLGEDMGKCMQKAMGGGTP